MLDGHRLVDAHVHLARRATLKLDWREWVPDVGGDPALVAGIYDEAGDPRPEAFVALLDEQGVDVALLFAEYSPKVTGTQAADDIAPLVAYAPDRLRLVGNVNPHLHFPIGAEVERQLALGAVALKLHPVHAGVAANDPMLYPAYEVCRDRGVAVIVHSGTSTFPGAMNRFADPVVFDDVLRDFPTLDLVLAHGGRGWWYDAAAFLAQSHPNVWIDVAGLPPRRLTTYYARHDFARLTRRFVFGTDWPAAPGMARNARAVAELCPDEETVELVLSGNAARLFGL